MASTKIRKEQISSGAADDGDVFTADGAGNTNIEAPTGGGVARSGATTDEHLAVWNGSNADSIKDGGVVPAGGGDVLGPATSVDNSIARFNGTDNKTIQGSLATIDDTGNVNIPTGTYNIAGSPHTHASSSWADIGCSVYTHADQTITNNTWTHVHWELEKYDTDTMHDNSTNPERITFNTAGKYLVVAQVEMFQFTGTIAMKILAGASGATEEAIVYAGDTAYDAPFMRLVAIISAAEDDYMEVQVWHDKGTDVTVVGSWAYEACYCQVQKIG